MKRSSLFLFFFFLTGAASGTLGTGCQDSFKNCENTLSCPPEGDGDGDTSTGGVEGDGDGDGDGDGTGGGDGDTGGSGSGGTGTGGDGTGGMGGDPTNPCSLCDADEQCTLDGECVECLVSDHCDDAEETPVCDTDAGICVECLAAADCEDPAFPMCESNACVVGCDVAEDCTRFGELGACDVESGECVACTPETDDRTASDDDCGTKVCNPETYACEDSLTQADKEACEPCIADAECATDHNCVQMDFQGTPRMGGYCLRTLASGACAQNPYRSPSAMRVSLSGAGSQVYCSINESLATCEAVLDLRDDKDCITADDCGVSDLADGLCETVSTVGNKCTYECDSAAQCRSSAPGSGCAGDAEGPAGSYCGGT